MNEVNQNLQMTIYHLAARANGYGDREILLRLDCLIKTKVPKFEQFYTTRADWDERKMVKKIMAVWDGITKGVFIPNDTSWKCKGCGHKTACREWFAEGGSAVDQQISLGGKDYERHDYPWESLEPGR